MIYEIYGPSHEVDHLVKTLFFFLVAGQSHKKSEVTILTSICRYY